MNFSGLRERIPYRFDLSDKDVTSSTILDEQEQEELIQRLRQENDRSNELTRIGIQVLLGISVLLQLVYLFNPSKASPLNAIWPPPFQAPSTPIPIILTLLAILIHADMVLLLHHHRTKLHVWHLNLFLPLPSPYRYALSAVAPTLCLSHGCSWQTILWWCITSAVAFVVQTVESTLQEDEDHFARLEKLKYRAPGA